MMVSAGVLAGAVQDPTPDAVSPLGLWQTLSDEDGRVQSRVLIYEEHGKVFGKVDRVLVTETISDICLKCKDERKDQPLVGLVIMRNMRASGNEYKGGDILDPSSGRIYRCKFKLDKTGSILTVRGYLGFSLFGRSQKWHRVTP